MAKTVLIKSLLPCLDPDDDASSNGFVFLGSGASDFTGIEALFDHVVAFYNGAGTGSTNNIAHYLGQQLDRNVGHATLTAYDITGHLDGSPHGSPVALRQFAPLSAATGTTPLPTGVAAAISFRADYGTDVEFGPGTRPRARDRNRVYIGPLNSSTLTSDSITHRCEFSDAFINDCLGSLFNLSEVVNETGDNWVLQVWSRVNAATKLPTEGFMDNRPDYQRRRSDPAPGSRAFRALSSV